MKKALVLGASGGIGYALVRQLVSRGIEVVAFSRGKEKLTALFEQEPNVTVFAGDVLVEDDVAQAASGVDVIFHSVNFPYPVWAEKHPRCLEIVLRVAETQNAKIALVDNIYAYGALPKVKVTEEMEKAPHTKKGKIRLAMENSLMASHVSTLIVHMPDVYGPNAESTLLHETFKKVVRHKAANFVGPKDIAREYLYTFDGAEAMVELSLREEAYNQNWNIPAVHPISGEDIITILREEAGYKASVRTVTKSMIRFVGLFQPFMREMVEMMYLTTEPVILSGEKYEKAIGPVPGTSYREGIKETLKWMEKHTV